MRTHRAAAHAAEHNFRASERANGQLAIDIGFTGLCVTLRPLWCRAVRAEAWPRARSQCTRSQCTRRPEISMRASTLLALPFALLYQSIRLATLAPEQLTLPLSQLSATHFLAAAGYTPSTRSLRTLQTLPLRSGTRAGASRCGVCS